MNRNLLSVCDIIGDKRERGEHVLVEVAHITLPKLVFRGVLKSDGS